MPSKVPHDKQGNLQPVQVPMEEEKLHSAPGSDSEVDLDPDGSIQGVSSKATKEGSQFKPTTEDELKAAADHLNAIKMNPEFSMAILPNSIDTKKSDAMYAESAVPCNTELSKFCINH